MMHCFEQKTINHAKHFLAHYFPKLEMSMYSPNFFKTCVNLADVGLPIIRTRVDFGTCFFHAISEESAALIRNLTTHRGAMQNSLDSTTQPLEEKISSVDSYLNDLWALYHSLLAQPAVYLDRELRFDWTSYLHPSTAKPLKYYDSHLSFDLIFCLHMKCSLHVKLARLIINNDFNNVSEAAKHLGAALGAISYVDAVLVPKWIPDNPGMDKPFEARSEYCSFLSQYYDACTQQMFATKALLTGSPLAGKLCLSVAEKMKAAILRAPASGVDSYVAHAAVQRDFYFALAYKLRAETHLGKNETGLAIGCCNFALVNKNYILLAVAVVINLVGPFASSKWL
jgi:hypothetical protein